MLSALSCLKTHLGIAAGNIAEDQSLEQWLTEADAIIKNYIRQPFIDQLAVYSLTGLDGNNAPLYVLPYGPLQVAVLTCTPQISNMAIVTVPSTTGMIVGMPVVGANDLTIVPAGTTIASINTGLSQVTLTNPVTTSNSTVNLYFGIDAYLDMGAFYGTGYGNALPPFSTTTQLTPGTDYAVRVDSVPPVWSTGLEGVANMTGWSMSKARIVARLNGVWGTGIERTRGLLTQGIGATKGCLKFVITAGFASVAGSDLELACNKTVARIRQARKWGASVSSQSYRGVSVSHGDGAKGGILTAEIKSLLGPYRSLVQSSIL